LIRGLDLKDLPAVRVAAETLAAKMYPELIPAVDREHELLRDLCLGTNHYARVIGEVGDPDAVLLAQTGDNLWAARRHATILLWHSVKPGAGYALLTDFVKWVKGQKHVVVAGFIDDFDMDARIAVLLRRAGFIQRGGAHVYFPGGSKWVVS
jgi:hypothetical protein